MRLPQLLPALASLCIIAIFATTGVSAQTFVTPRGDVQNVRFEQHEDGVIRVTYDLISADARAVFLVRLEVSHDAGATFDTRTFSVSGDVGDGVAPGTGKTIAWDSGKDVERVQLDRIRFRIVAVGEPLPVEAPRPPAVDPPAPPVAPPPPIPAPQTDGGGKGINKLVWVGLAGGAAAAGGLALGGGGSPPPPVVVPQVVTCTFSLSTTSLAAFTSAGGTSSVNVSASPAGCTNPSWTTSNNNSWITLSPSSGSGSSAVSVTAAANTSNATRAGSLTIANQTLSVSQGAASCSFSGNFIGGDGVPANSRNTQVNGDCVNCSVRNLMITASSNTCTWSIIGLPTWFQVVGGVVNRTGSSSFQMLVTERNFTNGDRTATFSVAGLAFTVRQCRTSC